ncbi:MAG TPA: FAD-dependent oxidoreductase, partial [bacterium]|nr:FAD-dependent oxidoreductase [bacterium]
ISASRFNLLAAGRCVSANPKALAAIRVMAPCMAMGQAAGVAAAVACQESKAAKDIPVQKIQQRLKAQGALI